MSTSEKILLTVVIIGVVLLGTLVALNLPKNVVGGTLGINISATNIHASSTTSTAGAAVRVMKNHPGRMYAILTNTTATIAYLAFATSSNTTLGMLVDNDFTVPLAASGGSYEINSDNPYTGQIFASSSVAVTIRAIEAY